MTVKKLIEKLSKLPPEKQAMVYCGNDPYEIKSIVFDGITVWVDTDNYED